MRPGSRYTEKGSQHWIQRAVFSRLPSLESQIAQAVGLPSSEVEWKSPLPPKYAEFRDGRVLRELGCNPSKRQLKDFWPRRGPVWDALAVVGNQYVLVEAKAHIPELISGGTGAKGDRLAQIEESLLRARGSLAPQSRVDWARSPFFQYANRLAYLQFLREDNELPAHLAFIYFINDAAMSGPESVEEWKGALRLMDAGLGFTTHRLSSFVHKLFLDVQVFEAIHVQAT